MVMMLARERLHHSDIILLLFFFALETIFIQSMGHSMLSVAFWCLLYISHAKHYM